VLRYELGPQRQPLVADACGIPPPAELSGAELSPGIGPCLLVRPGLEWLVASGRLGRAAVPTVAQHRALEKAPVPAVIVSPIRCCKAGTCARIPGPALRTRLAERLGLAMAFQC